MLVIVWSIDANYCGLQLTVSQYFNLFLLFGVCTLLSTPLSLCKCSQLRSKPSCLRFAALLQLAHITVRWGYIEFDGFWFRRHVGLCFHDTPVGHWARACFSSLLSGFFDCDHPTGRAQLQLCFKSQCPAVIVFSKHGDRGVSSSSIQSTNLGMTHDWSRLVDCAIIKIGQSCWYHRYLSAHRQQLTHSS